MGLHPRLLFHYRNDSWLKNKNCISPSIVVAHAVELDVLCCSVRSNMAWMGVTSGFRRGGRFPASLVVPDIVTEALSYRHCIANQRHNSSPRRQYSPTPVLASHLLFQTCYRLSCCIFVCLGAVRGLYAFVWATWSSAAKDTTTKSTPHLKSNPPTDPSTSTPSLIQEARCQCPPRLLAGRSPNPQRKRCHDFNPQQHRNKRGNLLHRTWNFHSAS